MWHSNFLTSQCIPIPCFRAIPIPCFRAKGDIRELKRVIRRSIQKARAPRGLWDFCGEWASAIRRKTALDLPSLNGMTPEETVHARSVDISAYAQFDWYSLV
jgi:hypothetical protein